MESLGMLMRENIVPDIIYYNKMFSLRCERFSMRTLNISQVLCDKMSFTKKDNHLNAKNVILAPHRFSII